MTAPALNAPEGSSANGRFTYGLVYDVFTVLDQHGYQAGGDRHIGQAVGLLLRLTRAYEGSADAEALS